MTVLIGNVMELNAVRRPNRAVSLRHVEICVAVPMQSAASMTHCR